MENQSKPSPVELAVTAIVITIIVLLANPIYSPISQKIPFQDFSKL